VAIDPAGIQPRRPAAIAPSAPGKLSGAALKASLYSIKVGEIWRFLKKQPISFWCINLYMFFEYVRPQQTYPGINVLPWTWGFIWLALASFIWEGFRLRRLYTADMMLALFSAAILLSSYLAVFPQQSFDELSLFFTWVLIYLLITNIVSTEQRFLIFMLAFMLYSAKMSQHGARTFAERGGGFASWGATGGSAWFRNSGEFGIQMCVFFPISVYFIQALRRYWPKVKTLVFLLMPASAAISIVASSSRGAVLGLVPVVFWMMMKSRQRVKALVLGVVMAATVWVLIPEEQKTRFTEMGDDATSQTRLIFWQRGLEMMREYPFTGVGYQNWFMYTSLNYPPLYGAGGRPFNQLPHNIFIEAGAELGYTGLLLFVGLIGVTLYTNYKTRKLARRLPGRGDFSTGMAHGLDAAMIGYLAAGMFVTVFYYPFFWINLAMTVALHNVVVNQVKQAERALASSLVSSPVVSRGAA
jgi:O-antigen ligase